MALYVLMHWILLVTAMVLGGIEIGTWLRARRTACAELKDRGWVCIDLPSPDSATGMSALYGQQPTLMHVMSAAVPVLGSFAVLTMAVWMLVAC